MSSGRKRNLIISYVLAAWTTFGVIAMFAGIFAGLVKTKTDQQALGYVLFLFVYLPALIGTGLSVSSIDRKLGTPGAVWVSVLWNSFVLTVLVLLTLIGLLSKLG